MHLQEWLVSHTPYRPLDVVESSVKKFSHRYASTWRPLTDELVLWADFSSELCGTTGELAPVTLVNTE